MGNNVGGAAPKCGAHRGGMGFKIPEFCATPEESGTIDMVEVFGKKRRRRDSSAEAELRKMHPYHLVSQGTRLLIN